MTTLNKTLELAQINNRVCPQPQRWQALYNLLPGKTRIGGGYQPAAPLILGSWWDTSHIQKITRLREHIEWSAERECLEEIHKFLTELPESDWFHIND